MITDEDIKKIIEAEREVFATKEEMDVKFDAIHESFSDLQRAVDAYAKKADMYFQEMAAMRNAISRHEEALKKLSEKVGIDLGF